MGQLCLPLLLGRKNQLAPITFYLWSVFFVALSPLFPSFSRWWFQTFVIFTLTSGNDPNFDLRTFFKWVGSTTNQFLSRNMLKKIHLGVQDKTYEKYTVHGNEDHSTQLNANGGVFKWCYRRTRVKTLTTWKKGSWKGLKLQKWSEEGELNKVLCCI